MTSNEKFEEWWQSPAAPFNYTVMDKASVRGIWDAAWNARLEVSVTSEQIEEIRSRQRMAAQFSVADSVRSMQDANDIAALLAHIDKERTRHERVTASWKAEEAGWKEDEKRYAALTPEVIETAIEACKEQEWLVGVKPQLAEPYAAARAALESLK